MTTFPLTESLGLKIAARPRMGSALQDDWVYIVYADDLEAILEKGQRVYGWQAPDGIHSWGFRKNHDDSHEAILINIQPIQRKVVFERCFTTYHAIVREEDFSRFKGKKVKVTIEEVP